MKKKLLVTLALVFALSFMVACSKEESSKQQTASSFPEKNITIVVPFSAGGGVDTNTRILADVGSDLMNGKKFIVENREGSSGIVGLTYAKDAKPDGYTLGATSYSMISKPVLRDDATFKTEDFIPIALMTTDATVLAIPAESDIETLEQFIEATKNKQININTSGFQSGPHIGAIKFANALDLDLTYVHTDGAGVQIQQLLGNHVDGAFLTVGEASPLFTEGKIKILGITSSERSVIMPDVPTFKEQGYDVIYEVFRGFSAPAGTPQEVVDHLELILKDIITSNVFKEKMEATGNVVNYKGQEEFKALVKREAEALRAIKDELKAK